MARFLFAKPGRACRARLYPREFANFAPERKLQFSDSRPAVPSRLPERWIFSDRYVTLLKISKRDWRVEGFRRRSPIPSFWCKRDSLAMSCRQNMIYQVCEIFPDISLCVLTVQYISPIIIFRINRALCNNGVGLKTLTVISCDAQDINEI